MFRIINLVLEVENDYTLSKALNKTLGGLSEVEILTFISKIKKSGLWDEYVRTMTLYFSETYDESEYVELGTVILGWPESIDEVVNMSFKKKLKWTETLLESQLGFKALNNEELTLLEMTILLYEKL